MIYNTGTVDVVEGSRTVTGHGTSFLKYVDVGALFKVQGDFDFYSVAQVLTDTSLILDRGYATASANLAQYTINPDKTPNANIPLISKNDPDASKTVSIGLSIIDRYIGSIMDFQNLAVYTPSGEKHGYVYNDYHVSSLAVDRVVAFQNASGETINYNRVLHNTLFEGQLNLSPSGETIAYDNGELSNLVPVKWDILTNLDSFGYAFIKSTAFGGSTSGEITISGELMFSDGAWDNNDRIAVFGKTHGLGQITAVSVSGEVLTAVSGESLTIGNFSSGMYLYNYTRNNYRTILGTAGNTVINPSTTDDWAAGDIVYTLKSFLEFEVTGIPATATAIHYGAKSNIPTDGVKQEHIDFGTGYNQVSAYDLPIDIPEIPETLTELAIKHVHDELVNHVTSGEAHLGSAIVYQDDLQGEYPMVATNVNDAINELKTRINSGVVIDGVISSGETKTSFFASGYVGIPTNFFSGEWWVRIDSGPAYGGFRRVQNVYSNTGRFVVSGEFAYIPATGNAFTLMNVANRNTEVVMSGSRYGALFDGVESYALAARTLTYTTGAGVVETAPSGEMNLYLKRNGTTAMKMTWASGELSGTVSGELAVTTGVDKITVELSGTTGAQNLAWFVKGFDYGS